MAQWTIGLEFNRFAGPLQRFLVAFLLLQNGAYVDERRLKRRIKLSCSHEAFVGLAVLLHFRKSDTSFEVQSGMIRGQLNREA